MEKDIVLYVDAKVEDEGFSIDALSCEYDGKKYLVYTGDCEWTGGIPFDGYFCGTYFGLHTIDPETGEKNYEFPDGFADNADINGIFVKPCIGKYEIESCWMKYWDDEEEDDE